MAKRASSSASNLLTGGTGDVNPQYLGVAYTQGVANAVESFGFSTPIVRVGSDNSGTATIMEILKVFFDLPPPDAVAAGATLKGADAVLLTSQPGSAFTPFNDGHVIAQARSSSISAFTAGGSGMMANQTMPHMYDCTDGDGHGVLVATDNLWLQVDTTGFTNAATFRIKILYRFKKVKLVEYIGIVQSQQ